jgi:peptidoglycan/LPS O-acetylase OafA/YrhL
MCYSLYLIHWPVVKATCHIFNYDLGIQNTWGVLLVTIPACVLFSAAAGWGFHLLVERRFLNTPPVLPWHAVGQRAVPAPACRSVTAMPAVPPSMPI